ncbi:large conductance mechanosensitive channel protein MscL [Candidatus Gracilibacteria bacterium]|nr:large conductance mechanosensitive channel protein MscL [Candidatus Gracilibacteria bacterium]
MKIFKEFKEFAIKGNVVDLAVAVIIGAAFGKIVTSIVEDLVMPVIGWLIGDIDFSNIYYAFGNPKVTESMTLAEAKAQGAVLAYGNFLTIVINFIIVAIAIFIVVKILNSAKDKMIKQEEKKEEKPKGPTQEQLLAEIRDLLKKKA